MACGIFVWGDQPLGWRFMSTVFGSLTLVGMYFLGWIVFGTESAALWVAAITICNQLLYVQARIGMLDTFMMGFLVWAIAFFWAARDSRRNTASQVNLLYCSGFLFGLAAACKWFALVPWIACLGFVGGIKIRQLKQKQNLKQHSKSKKSHSFIEAPPLPWKNISLSTWIRGFVLVPILAYSCTFLPFLAIPGALDSIVDLWNMQTRMWDGQLRVIRPHPYMSHWYEWPLLTRPIWYAFDREGPGMAWVRGVLLIGNPIIMITGLLALAVCAWDGLVKQKQDAFFILFFYSIFYFCWIVIPRKIEFYYYYYPAGLILSLALTYLIHHQRFKFLKWPGTKWIFLGASLGMFIYFFPLLAALKIPAPSFRDWMWSPRWI